mgnify:CR=1 FL=1
MNASGLIRAVFILLISIYPLIVYFGIRHLPVSFFALVLLALLAFIALMIGSGIRFYRLGKRSESDFFLAGRGLPWWLPASSVFSTHTATDTPMWITGVIYGHGLRGLWYTFFTAWTAVGAFVSARIFRRSLAYTQAEWQTQRFGGLGAEMLRGWMAGWQVFMNMFILGWVGIAMGKVAELVREFGETAVLTIGPFVLCQREGLAPPQAVTPPQAKPWSWADNKHWLILSGSSLFLALIFLALSRRKT